MAKVFKFGLIFFVIIAFCTSNQNKMFEAILSSPQQVFDLIKVIVLSACLWNGFLNIIKASGLIKQLSFLLKPILNLSMVIRSKMIKFIYISQLILLLIY